MGLQFLRFFAIIPFALILMPYLWIRYQKPEERNRQADAQGQKLKSWVMG